MKYSMNGGLFDYRTPLGKFKIGAFLPQLIWDSGELEGVKAICSRIWKEVCMKSNNFDFMGLIRFDLVPNFIDPTSEKLGTLVVAGIYEINTHSPEEIAGISALEYFTGLKTQDDPCEIFAKKLREIFGDSEISLVCGNNLLKREWGKIFLDKLKKMGLSIRRMTPAEVMNEEPKILFRWGDVRLDGPSQFDDNFTNWLVNQKKGAIFNTIPNGIDLGDKTHLLSSDDSELGKIFGNNRALLSEEDIWWSVESDDYSNRHAGFLVKPNKGASGNDICFGENMMTTEWIEVLKTRLSQRGYSIWEAKWLPKININEESLAMDINPVFWATGNEIEYLYTIVRTDKYSRYVTERTINVAQGAGLALHTIQ